MNNENENGDRNNEISGGNTENGSSYQQAQDKNDLDGPGSEVDLR